MVCKTAFECSRPMSTRGRKGWLCVAPAVVCALDAALTLIFQPAAYWSGKWHPSIRLQPKSKAAFSWGFRLVPLSIYLKGEFEPG
jgi:hypothetical protein